MNRDRQQSEQRLIDAVGQILATEGFSALGINAVARTAGVDKVLIYRYFDGLPDLLRAYGESGDFWPSMDEVLDRDVEAIRSLPLAARVETVVIGLFDALRNRPQTIEILAWEAVEQNALTETLAGIREQWAQKVISETMTDAADHDQDLLALASLLVAGFQYLLIRSRRSAIYGGLELTTDQGWERIRTAIRLACSDPGRGATVADPIFSRED